MDGSPKQNSAKARKAITKVWGMIFKIPAGSPALNPIENIFNIAAKDLRQAVDKNITKKIFELFSGSPINHACISSREINKIIETMDKNVTMILASK